MSRENNNNQKVYLKDFLPSLPLPSLYMVDREELTTFFTQPLKVEYKVVNRKVVFIRYPDLFGTDSVLSNVWIRKDLVMNELTNYHLYCLERLLNDPDEDRNILCDLPGSLIFVTSLTFPLKMSPAYLSNLDRPAIEIR